MSSVAPIKTSSIAALDPLLGPLVTNRKHLGPGPLVLAILTRTLGNDPLINPGRTKIWIKSRLGRSHPEVIVLIDSRPQWQRFVKAARAHVGSAQSSSSHLPAAAARRLLARALTPLDLGDAKLPNTAHQFQQIMNARHTIAVYGMEAIRSAHVDKMETILVGDPWLSVNRHITPTTARRYRKIVTSLGWVRLVSGGRTGVPARLRLTKLSGDAGKLAERYYDSIGHLASQDADHNDRLATLIASAAHPAWTYGEYTVAHWLTAVADAAGVDPVGLGVPVRRPPKIRKQLAVLFAGGDTVVDALDLHALDSGAFLAYEAAQVARRAAAAARTAEVLASRSAKTAEFAARADAKTAAKAQAKDEALQAKANGPTAAQVTERLLARCGPVPGPTPPNAMMTWFQAAGPLLAKCPPPMRVEMAGILAPMAATAGWDAELTERFRGKVAG